MSVRRKERPSSPARPSVMTNAICCRLRGLMIWVGGVGGWQVGGGWGQRLLHSTPHAHAQHTAPHARAHAAALAQAATRAHTCSHPAVDALGPLLNLVHRLALPGGGVLKPGRACGCVVCMGGVTCVWVCGGAARWRGKSTRAHPPAHPPTGPTPPPRPPTHPPHSPVLGSLVRVAAIPPVRGGGGGQPKVCGHLHCCCCCCCRVCVRGCGVGV